MNVHMGNLGLHEHFYRSWFPHTFVYAKFRNPFPFLAKCIRKSFFSNLCKIMSVENKTDLQNRYKAAIVRDNFATWGRTRGGNLVNALNLDMLDTR